MLLEKGDRVKVVGTGEKYDGLEGLVVVVDRDEPLPVVVQLRLQSNKTDILDFGFDELELLPDRD